MQYLTGSLLFLFPSFNPINVYGKSKLAGEKAIQETGCKYLVFRTSWVHSLHGHNFLKTMLRLITEREELNIINDQLGAPTWSGTIADITASCIPVALDRIKNHNFSSEVLHLTAKGQTSWYGFTSKIVEIANNKNMPGIKVKKISPIPTSQYPTPATRPLNSRLNNDKLVKMFDVEIPSWDEALLACLGQ